MWKLKRIDQKKNSPLQIRKVLLVRKYWVLNYLDKMLYLDLDDKLICHLCQMDFDAMEKRRNCYCGAIVHISCFVGDGDSCSSFAT